MESAYIAHLWEYPELTLALFGVQVHTEEAGQMYLDSGIEDQLRQALAAEPAMLHMRELTSGNEFIELQYWRTHQDLADFSRRMPHMAWWKWLIDHDGQGLSFYHEIYQCRTAEAVYESGTTPVGPGAFCTTSPSALGGNRSQERQQRFLEAQRQLAGR